MCNNLCVVPPSPKLEELIIRSKKRLASGKELPSKASGKLLDLQRAFKILNRPTRTRAHTLIERNVSRAPILGTRKALVLLVDFSDETATLSQSHYHDMLFGLGTHSTGTMREYYREASYNQLDVIGEVSGADGPTNGWYRAPQTKDYYTNNDYGFGNYPKNAQKLVEDVVDLAAPHVNFADYDNDGDGVVDALVIIAAGTGAEASGNTGDIWSHKWAITPRTHDGVSIQSYFMAPEDGRVGVMAHELGHLLMKWPDLYDTDYSSRGTGRWDLMAGGSWNNGGDTPAHPTAWCKYKAGWIEPEVILDDSKHVTLKPYFENGDVYKLPVGDANSDEYFLVSNRQKSGFDKFLPGEGCIIEHVDDGQSNNTDENHYLVDIEQADGKRDLNANANSGDATDAYPTSSNNVFDESSNPNSNAYSGNASKVSVSDIAQSGDNITAKISVGDSDGGTTTTETAEWYVDRAVIHTFTSRHAQNAWANIQGLGWRKIEPGFPDGVSNCFTVFCDALANSRRVTVYADAEFIYRVYMS